MHPAVPFMAFFLNMFLAFAALGVAGGLMYMGNRAGLRSMQVTAALTFLGGVAAYAGLFWLTWGIDEFWFVVAATATWVPMFAMVTGYNVLNMPENIRNSLSAVDEIIAFGPDRVIAELDADKDGVVSKYDLETSANHIMAMGLSKNAVDTLSYNMSTFGHRVGDGVHVISARDLPAARLKVREEWAKWLPASDSPRIAAQ
jgi:hypothetical protein